MAKESMKARERKREKLAAQYSERRKVLRKAQAKVIGKQCTNFRTTKESQWVLENTTGVN